MQEYEHAFHAIKKEIQEEAAKEADRIYQEVKSIEDQAAASMKIEAQKDAEMTLQQELSQIQSDASAEIAAMHAARMKKLVAKRDEYTDAVFQEAYRKLEEFTQSDDYKAYMIKQAKMAGQYGLDDVVMYVKADDMPLAETLQAAYGLKVRVAAREDVHLGGFIIEDEAADIILNETLELALNEQRDWFTQHSGMNIR